MLILNNFVYLFSLHYRVTAQQRFDYTYIWNGEQKHLQLTQERIAGALYPPPVFPLTALARKTSFILTDVTVARAAATLSPIFSLSRGRLRDTVFSPLKFKRSPLLPAYVYTHSRVSLYRYISYPPPSPRNQSNVDPFCTGLRERRRRVRQLKMKGAARGLDGDCGTRAASGSRRPCDIATREITVSARCLQSAHVRLLMTTCVHACTR